MSKRDDAATQPDNPPAFPPSEDMKGWFVNAFPGREYESREWWTGMKLRDYFAGQALIMGGMYLIDDDAAPSLAAEEIARRAYGIADALLAERAKPNPDPIRRTDR